MKDVWVNPMVIFIAINLKRDGAVCKFHKKVTLDRLTRYPTVVGKIWSKVSRRRERPEIPEFIEREKDRGSKIDRVNFSRTIHPEVGLLVVPLVGPLSTGTKLQTDLKIGCTVMELALAPPAFPPPSRPVTFPFPLSIFAMIPTPVEFDAPSFEINRMFGRSASWPVALYYLLNFPVRFLLYADWWEKAD